MSYIDEFKKNINSSNKLVSKFLSLEEQVQLKKINNKFFFPSNTERKRVIINDSRVNGRICVYGFFKKRRIC